MGHPAASRHDAGATAPSRERTSRPRISRQRQGCPSVSPEPLDPALFSPDTRELIALLHKHHVRYLIVGGGAVIYYGHIRTTGDVDFFYDPTEANAQQLFAALSEFWAGRVPNLDGWQELAEPGMIL